MSVAWFVLGFAAGAVFTAMVIGTLLMSTPEGE